MYPGAPRLTTARPKPPPPPCRDCAEGKGDMAIPLPDIGAILTPPAPAPPPSSSDAAPAPAAAPQLTAPQEAAGGGKGAWRDEEAYECARDPVEGQGDTSARPFMERGLSGGAGNTPCRFASSAAGTELSDDTSGSKCRDTAL